MTDNDTARELERSARARSRLVVLCFLALGAGAGFASDSSSATGLALLALAAIPAVFAVPPSGRPFVGGALVVVAGGVGLVGPTISGGGTDPLTWVAAVAVAVAGAVTAWRGRSWPTLGRRFTTPDDQRVLGPTDLWRELDRGNDPTGEPAGGEGEETESSATPGQ